MKNYSSLILSAFSHQKTLTFEDEKDNSLEYMNHFIDKNILVDLTTRVICKPTIDTTYTGSYPIRITGECLEENKTYRKNFLPIGLMNNKNQNNHRVSVL